MILIPKDEVMENNEKRLEVLRLIKVQIDIYKGRASNATGVEQEMYQSGVRNWQSIYDYTLQNLHT